MAELMILFFLFVGADAWGTYDGASTTVPADPGLSASTLEDGTPPPPPDPIP